MPYKYVTINGKKTRIDTSALSGITTKLEGRKLVSKGTRVSVEKQVKDWTSIIEYIIKDAAKKGQVETVNSFSQLVLDLYVHSNNNTGFGYNNYLGAVNHAYRAETFIDGKRKRSYGVSENAGVEWGKEEELGTTPTRNWPSRKMIFRIKKVRHGTKLGRKSRRTKVLRLLKAKAGASPFDSNGKRISFRGVMLNSRGRRISGGKIAYKKYGSGSSYDIVWKVGHRINGKGVRVKKSDLENGTVKTRSYHYPYLKKKWQPYDYGMADIRKDNAEKYAAYRYKKKGDRLGAKAWKGTKHYARSGHTPRKGECSIVIYNVAPFADKLQRMGYDVMPRNSMKNGKMRMVENLMIKNMSKTFYKQIHKISKR